MHASAAVREQVIAPAGQVQVVAVSAGPHGAEVISPRGWDLPAAPRSRVRSAAVRRRRTGQGRQGLWWPARRRTC